MMGALTHILLLTILSHLILTASICTEGQFLLSSICFSCKTNCKKCSYFNDCTTCFSGYYITNNDCLPCSANCKTCLSSDDCTQCYPKYFVQYRECAACLDGCSVCTSSDKCNACLDTYYLAPSYKCEYCNDNCLTCNPDTMIHECSQCMDGYYFVAESNSCESCDNTCKSCTMSGSCTECLSYYYKLPDGTCSLCGNNCKQCTSSTICQSCTNNYYVQETLDAFNVVQSAKCALCTIDNCMECIWKESLPGCSQCASTFYSNGIMCLPCPANCDTCSRENGVCIKCSSGYFLVNSTCISCLSNCALCISNIDCLSCNEGYFLFTESSTCSSAQKCVSLKTCSGCPTGCSKCSSKNECLICYTGYYMNSDKECSICPVGCLSCSSNLICTSCVEHGYFMTSYSTCEPCLNGCYTCTTSETCADCTSLNGYDSNYNSGYDCILCSNKCDSCEEHVCRIHCTFGIMIFLTSGYVCTEECNSGCQECLDPARCITCAKGYYLDSDKLCQKCIDNCEMCTSLSNCYQCKKQYYPKDNTTCESCIPNCYFCIGPSTCEICMPRYYSTGIACNKCQYGCLSCNSTRTCTKCSKYLDGLAIYLDDNSQSCVECPPGCYDCDDAVNCKKCKIGYIMGSEGVCLKCPTFCIHCTELSSCRICSSETYLSNGLCLKCGADCLACKNDTYCTECSVPYLLSDSNECQQQCEDSCTACVSYSICTSCKKGYYLLNNKCEQCPDFSDSCSYDGFNVVLASCTDGYYILYNKCTQIPIKNCASYDSQTKICTVCSTGYRYTTDNLCEPACSSHCLKCSKPYSCSQCISGYVIANENECKLVCADNCDTCLNSTYCSICSAGYIAENGLCTSCSNAICLNNCSQPNDAGCYICDQYYYVFIANQECKQCNKGELSRSPIDLSFSICTGEFTDIDTQKNMGTGYSGAWFEGNNLRGDACSMAHPMYGVIPYGTYRITSIICKFGSQGSSRVLKLEPISVFSTDKYFSSFFSDLYIYSDSETLVSNYSNTMGYNGIVALSSIRDELTVGDVINVVYDNCTLTIDECEVYPPPIIGHVNVSQTTSKTNEYLINFIGWGGSDAMDISQFMYKVCVVLSPFECIEICADDATSSANGILCNSNNTMQLGTQSISGIFPAKFRVRYRGTNQGIYSMLAGKITILEQFSSIRSINEDIKDLLVFNDLYNEINAKRNLLYKEQGFNFTRTTYLGNYMNCPTDYCYNDGACSVVKGLLSCQCKKPFAGELCMFYSDPLSEIAKYFDTLTNSFMDFSDLTNVNVNQIYEVLTTITIVPEALTHDVYSRIMYLATNYTTVWNFEIVERIENIIPNLMASIKYRTISEAQNSDKASHQILLDDIISLEQLIKFVVNYKTSERSFHYKQSMGLNGVYGYYFKSAISMYETNASFYNDTLLGCTIAYPFAFSTLFDFSGYSIISNMLSVFAYEDGEFGEFSSAYSTLQFMTQESTINLEDSNLDVKCACYDYGYSELSSSPCKAPNITKNNVSCDCYNSNMCFVVYKEKAKYKYISVVSVVIIVVPFLIAYRKRLKCCKKKIKAPSKEIIKSSTEGSDKIQLKDKNLDEEA